LQVFFRGNGNSLQYVAQTSATDPNAWGSLVNLGGGLNNAPAVEANSDGRLEVFVTGLDNSIFHIWQTSPGGNAWSPFHGLGGWTATTQLAVGRNTDGTLQVFYRASDNTLYFIRQSHSAPSGWAPHTPLGGGLIGDPSVGTNADGRLEVFVRGTDNGLHHQWQTTPGGSFSGWQARGGVLTSGAVPARNADGRLSVVFRSSGNALSYNAQSSPGSAFWAGFTTVGGNASTF
jgi:hypothetical protein